MTNVTMAPGSVKYWSNQNIHSYTAQRPQNSFCLVIKCYNSGLQNTKLSADFYASFIQCFFYNVSKVKVDSASS